MDINEFVKQVQPRAKRSRLDPFKEQIFELKARGYANWQIRDWLASNGIDVTQESVRKFVVTRGESNQKQISNPIQATGPQASADSSQGESSPVVGSSEPEALGLKQRLDKRADEFFNQENTNQVLKILKKKDP